MTEAVGYPLLAGAQLLAVAAVLALALAAAAPGLRGRGTPLAVAGALLLAVVETLTALQLELDARLLLRAAGLALLGTGLALGALRPRLRDGGADRADPGDRGDALPGSPAREAAARAVLPLAALLPGAAALPTAAPSLALDASAVALTGALASAVAGRRRPPASAWWSSPLSSRDASGAGRRAGVGGALGRREEQRRRAGLASGLLLLGVSSLLPVLPGSLLRAVGAAGLLVAVAVLARGSLRGKLLLVTAAAAVSTAVVGVVVVGTILSLSAAEQQQTTAAAVAEARQSDLASLQETAVRLAPLVAFCEPGPSGCSSLLDVVSGSPSFAARVGADGTVVTVGEDAGAQPGLQALARTDGSLVRDVLAGADDLAAGPVVLPDPAGPRLAVVAAAAAVAADGGREVAVYGSLLGPDFLGDPLAPGFAETLLVAGRPVASSEPASAEEVADEAALYVAAGLLEDGVTVDPDGDRSALHLVDLIAQGSAERVAVLAVAGPEAAEAGGPQGALRGLFVSAVVVALLVALVAAALGERIAAPVRRLTAVAARVRRGDLDVRAAVTGSDEVAVLARTFDAMTSSLASNRDDLVRAAAQEAELRGRLEAVLRSLDDGVVAVDGAGVVVSANRAALVLLGRADEDVAGRPVEQVVTLVDREGDAVPTAHGLVREQETVLVRADGTDVPVAVAVAPLRGADGRTRGQVLVLRDRTRERQVERMKTEFLSNVSHELRTPLTPILGYGEMLRARPTSGGEVVERWSGEVVRGARRLARVVDLLVDVAALEAGNLRSEPAPVELGPLLEARAEVWRTRTPERAADLVVDVPPDLPPARLDARWAAKALDELIDNALKYSDPRDPVALMARRSGDGLRILVRDAGGGMDDEAAAAAFEAFRQGDGSATRSVGGLGLGLGFVRRLAEESGWRLALRSEPGVGTVVVVEVPPAAEAAPRPAGERAPRRGRAGGRARSAWGAVRPQRRPAADADPAVARRR